MKNLSRLVLFFILTVALSVWLWWSGALGEATSGTPIPTFTLAASPAPTATFTPTFTLSPTFHPTFTPSPTPTPRPTRTPTATPSPTPTGTLSPTPLPKDWRWISVDLTAQKLYAYEDTHLVKTFTISSGKWSTPTVTGRFRIYLKLRYDDMQGPDYYIANVPYVMYFHEGYGIHGAPWNKKIGTPQSHGCINMRVEDARWLYEWAPLNTLVIVHK